MGHQHTESAQPPIAQDGHAVDSLVNRGRSQALGDLLRRSALRYPGKLAVVASDVRWTYADFDQAVNRVANAVAERGVMKGDRVAVLSHNGWEFAALTFALARVGAVLVPINFMLRSHEVAYILDHCRPVGVIVEDQLFTVAEEAISLSGLDPAVRGWIALGGDDAPAGWERVVEWSSTGDATPPAILVGDEDPLRLMYTSGTEARPKGAMHTSRSLIAQYVSCIVDGEMAHDDVDLHALPMYHCAQLDCFFGPDVYVGATSVILARPAPELILETIERERVTKLFAPPTVWISLLRNPAFDDADLSSLQKAYYGASPMPVEILREMRHRLPGVRLWNFYGQTEMAPVATVLKPDAQLTHAGAAGLPALNVETRLVDDDDNPIPVGEVGEVVHRSPHATLGYYHDAAQTAAAFRGGWFHSGDLGVMDADGYLTIVDRKKDMIKTGGENVASREVEEAIYQLDGVAEVAVFGVPDPRWVEAVTAAVVPRPGSTLTSEEVTAHCRGQLAGYKAPKHVVLLEELPKNPSGKILKRELREAFATAASQPAESVGVAS